MKLQLFVRHRYLKHLKSRNAELTYDQTNVIDLELTKDGPNTYFRHLGHSEESDHLINSAFKTSQKEALQQCIILRRQGVSWRQIPKQLNIPWSHMTVKRKVEQALHNSQNN